MSPGNETLLTQAALDGLKIAEGPKDMSRIAQLAER